MNCLIMKLTTLDKLFNINYGNGFELINMDLLDSDSEISIPFVSRTSTNNGISAYVKQVKEIDPFKSGLITVSVGGSVLETFLQTRPFYTGFHVLVLTPKRKMSDLEKLFYCYCIRKNKYRYNYGRQANKTLKGLLIPTYIPDNWKNIDINSLNNLINKPFTDLKMSLDVQTWDYFNLIDLFEISASRDELIEELEQGGNTPYVTSSDNNNGITSYVQSDPTNQAGTMTANRGGSVGYFFYQPLSYKATPVDVRILTPKFKINIYIGLFLRSVLELEKYRYNYSRKMGTDRLEQIKMRLPSLNKGPDWNYMESEIYCHNRPKNRKN